MKMNSNFFWISCLAMSLVFVACDSDDDDGDNAPVNDPEVITDVELTFFDIDAQTSQTFLWSDPDGPGGESPTIDVISIAPGAYNVSIEVRDASNPNDVEDLTEEIGVEEADEHQFFFELLNGADSLATIAYADVDADGNPVGLQTVWAVAQPTVADEKVRVTLIHEPNKAAPGAAMGILSPEVGGETDVEIEFELSVN